MKKPFLSIIIPTLNEERYLPKLITSLSLQTDRDFEVIVVDGNSVDKTRYIALRFRSQLPFLRVIDCQKPSLPKQRNIGAKAARASWFAFLDADTTVKKRFVETVKINTTGSPGVILSLSNPDQHDCMSIILNTLINTGQIASFLIGKPFVPGTMSIFDKRVFNRIGGFSENHTFAEDHDITQKLHRHGITISNIYKPIYSVSFRRFRSQGIFKTLTTYASTSIQSYLFNTVPTEHKGYNMGGHNFR